MEPFIKDSTIPAVINMTIKDARNKIILTILSLLNIFWGHQDYFMRACPSYFTEARIAFAWATVFAGS